MTITIQFDAVIDVFFRQCDIWQPIGNKRIWRHGIDTNAFKSSFVPSSVSIWNNLPHEALIAPTITSFKSFTAPLFLLL